jgi:adenosine deaminase
MSSASLRLEIELIREIYVSANSLGLLSVSNDQVLADADASIARSGRLPLGNTSALVDQYRGFGGNRVELLRRLLAGLQTKIEAADASEGASAARLLHHVVPRPLWPRLGFKLPDDEDSESEWQELARSGLSDGHVHSGGSTSPIGSLDLAFIGLSRMSKLPGVPIVPVSAFDASGRSYDLVVLTQALGFAAAALRVPDDERDLVWQQYGDSAGLDALSKVFWSEVRDELVAGRNSDKAQRGMAGLGVVGFTPSFDSFLNALLGRGSSHDPSVRLLEGALIATLMANFSMTSRVGSNLSAFVGGFATQSDFRWQFYANSGLSAKTGESIRVRKSLSEAAAERLNRIELRKTIHPSGPDQSMYHQLRDDLWSHFQGAQVYLEGAERKLAFQMPVGLLRHRLPKHVEKFDDSQLRYRYPLLAYLSVLQGVGMVLKEEPTLAQALGSIDVAGMESATPNWVFSLAFQYFEKLRVAEHLPTLDLSIHAGEDFVSPLNGLRAVAEAAGQTPRPVRIGHALALDAGHVSQRELPSEFKAYGLVEDIIWAAESVMAHFPDRWEEHEPTVKALVLNAASQVFGIRASFSDLRAWYRLRSDANYVAGLGIGPLQSPALYPTVFGSPVSDDSIDVHRSSVTEALVLADLFQVAFYCEIDGREERVSVDTLASVRDGRLAALLRDLYLLLYPAVFAVLRDSGTVIECCPSSNLSIGAYGDFSELPIARFMEEGLICTLNTDDPGVFGVTVHDEFRNIRAASLVDHDQSMQLAAHGNAFTARTAMVGTGGDYSRFVDVLANM